MEMWRPAAVFLCQTDASELLAACDALSNLQVTERLYGEMPVESEEFLAAIGFMPQNDHRSVVQWSGIIRHGVDDAIQRRADRSTRLNKKVHAKVHRAPFVSGIAARAEQRRSVKQARFIVTADTNARACAFHGAKYFLCELGRFRCARVGAQKSTANAQIKNDARCCPQISFQHRSSGACVRFQPPLDLFTLWNGRKPASRTKSVVRETRVDFCQPRQCFPSGLLGDCDVRVVRLNGFAVRRIGDAHRQTRADQRIENGQLQFIQWKCAVISRDDGSCSLKRVIVSENAVSGGNRRLRRSDPVVHIAKINQAHDLARLRPRIVDQHVVVVRIAVNYAAAQLRQDRHDFRLIEREKSLHQRAPLRIGDVLDIVFDPTRARRIPFQFAFRSRVRKRLQRRVHLPQKPAKIAKKFRRVRADSRKNFSIHESEQPDEARRAFPRGNRSKQVAAAIGRDARQGQLRRTLRQMPQRPALQIDKGMLPRRVHYFEDERTSVRARQMEVVVVFARQRSGGGLYPVEFPRQANRFRFGHRLSYAGLQQHAPNLIRNSRSASILDGL